MAGVIPAEGNGYGAGIADLETGTERQLTNFTSDFDILDRDNPEHPVRHDSQRFPPCCTHVPRTDRATGL
jgi:hypothetical protein